MNKLSLAVGAVLTAASLNIASAQGTGSANPAMGGEMKREQAAEPGDTSGTTAPGRKGMYRDGMKKGMHMRAMDTNSDGMVSKEEFMTFHEAMYDSMKKNKDGTVDLKDMREQCRGMAK